MELREWLIILGLALVTLIVVDGVRRLQRQRRIPRLDEVAGDARGSGLDPDEEAREAEINWELPNGGARVVRPADYSRVQSRPKPKLQRQEHPGPSRVLSGLKGALASASFAAPAGAVAPSRAEPAQDVGASSAISSSASASSARVDLHREEQLEERAQERQEERARKEPEPRSERARFDATDERSEPSLSALEPESDDIVASSEPLTVDDEYRDEHEYQEAERYRLVDFEGMGESLKSGSKRVGASMQRSFASLQQRLAERREQWRLDRERREQEKAERAVLEEERRRLAREQAEREMAMREKERRRLEATAIEAADDDDPLFAPPRARREREETWDDFSDFVSPSGREAARQETGQVDGSADSVDSAESPSRETGREAPVAPSRADVDERFHQGGVVRAHPVLEKALRHDVSADHARHALSHADEIIVISVMSRDDEGFSGTALLDLMLACGLRYSREMGIFHRFETEDPESQLQFSMVNVVKPGTFPIEAMDDFRTPGITLLMPLPGANDTAAAFEAMVETAMVIVRHLGGELKDENRSVMTAQTVEFARQRVQEFERRNRLNRYQMN